MLAALLALLQEGHEAAGEHAAEAAQTAGEHVAEATEHAAEATGHAAEHAEPYLVEAANHYLGPVVLNIERAIMPSIYGLFGATWHEPNLAAGEMIIPPHVVWSIILFIICAV